MQVQVQYHPRIGQIRWLTNNAGDTFTYYVKNKRMVKTDKWGDVSYPMLTKDNQTIWAELTK